MALVENSVNKATFNPKVKAYISFVVLIPLIMSVIGIIIVPFWLLGLGQWLSDKYFKTLKCELTNKNLKFSKGILVHIEKTIPLENIQDLSFIGGPILRSFGLTLIRVETAGGGGPHNNNMMSMLGINNADEFKNEILEQREKIILEKRGTQLAGTNNISEINILNDIKNELININKTLAAK